MRHLGRYRLDERLGSGAFATVWRGYDTELDSPVAVKVLAENWADDSDVRERFLAEARLLRRISDPRIVRVHDVGTAQDSNGIDRPYFVMDLVTGGTVADHLGATDPQDGLRLAVQAARAVQALHDQGVVHRDVKPGNLLVADPGDEPEQVVVADLGSAKMLAEASTLTVVTGTPAYMAPEQATRMGGFDARADVYAVAAVAYHLLAGRPPYDAASPAAVSARADVPPTPVAARLGLPTAVDRVISRALAKDPTRRQASCTDLADDLEAAVAGDRVRTGPRRYSLGPVLLLALLVFAVSAVGGWLLG